MHDQFIVDGRKALMRALRLASGPPTGEPDAPEGLDERIDRLIEDRFVPCGWRLVTTHGSVSFRSDAELPSVWGGRGHRVYVRRVESGEAT